MLVDKRKPSEGTKKHWIACTFVAVWLVAISLTGCKEDIDTSNRYTFVGKTVGSFLESHPEIYSSFNYILSRSGEMSLLKAYGAYTCFAPTNEAIARYLVEQDSIWRKSLEPGSEKVIWTGITSPVLEELTDSMCDVISKTHILPAAFLSMEMDGDVVPAMNLNNRFLTLRVGVNENLRPIMYVNGAELIAVDEQVENGVVHTVASALNPSTNTVPAQIEEMPFLSLFYEGLKKTGLEDKMQLYRDDSYKDGDRTQNNAGLDDATVRFPPHRYFGYTAFCEPDEVFHELGIYSIEDLYRQCLKWYPEATDPDYTSPDNALYKFMAYHLLEYHLLYTRLVFNNLIGNAPGSPFNSEIKFPYNSDRVEYYETMQGPILKIIMPRSMDLKGIDKDGVARNIKNTIFLNFGKDAINPGNPFNSSVNGIPVNVRVLDPADIMADPARYPKYVQEALNGSIHLIDHPLVYNEDVMAGYVLNGIIRMDWSALIPELTNNHLRWYDGTAGYQFLSDAAFYIPHDYSDHVKFYEDDCRLSYYSPKNEWDEYEGDLLTCRGSYDFAYQLPILPAGTYEIRISSINGPDRGMTQFYLDGEVCGLPKNNKNSGTDPCIGYIYDRDTDDNGVENDKVMKNHNYLKAPITYNCANAWAVIREYNLSLRYVITTKYLSADHHWLRIKNVDELSQYYNSDYFEIVPVGWLRRDDLTLEEKRQ